MDILEKQASLNEANYIKNENNVISVGYCSENTNTKINTFSKDENIDVPVENSVSTQNQQVTDNEVPETNNEVVTLIETRQFNFIEETMPSEMKDHNLFDTYTKNPFKDDIKSGDDFPSDIDEISYTNEEETDTKIPSTPLKKKIVSEDAIEIKKHFKEREKEGIHSIFNYNEGGVVVERRIIAISQFSNFCVEIPLLADILGTTNISYVHRMIKKCEKVFDKTFMFKNNVNCKLVRNSNCSLNEWQSRKFGNQKKGFLTIEGFFIVLNYIKAHERL